MVDLSAAHLSDAKSAHQLETLLEKLSKAELLRAELQPTNKTFEEDALQEMQTLANLLATATAGRP